ncbi:hypothetical protein PFISCL1PPCAC_17617, partial [Pristionchus fissidentatus]
LQMPTLACRLCMFVTIFAASTALLCIAWIQAPESAGAAPKPRSLPRTIEDLKGVAIFLGSYRDEHFVYTVFLFSFAYLFKQAFAIPGSFFMNLLAGALFGRWLGAALVCPLTAAGASLCYCLSAKLARPFVERCFKKRIRVLRDTVHDNEHRLFYFLLCARFFPFTPHWLLNICSPFIDIRLGQFALSVLIGLAPYNILCVHAGGTLAQLRMMSDVIDVTVLLQLVAVAAIMAGMGVWSKKRNRETPSIVH